LGAPKSELGGAEEQAWGCAPSMRARENHPGRPALKAIEVFLPNFDGEGKKREKGDQELF